MRIVATQARRMRAARQLLLTAVLGASLVSAAAWAQSVPGMPPIRQLPDKEAVQVVGGALQLGGPAAVIPKPAAVPPPPEKKVASAEPGPDAVDERGPVTKMTASMADPIPARPVASQVEEAAALRGLVADATPMDVAPAGQGVRPPAPVMTLRPGSNAMFAIARTHLNRLVTPFANPVVKTTAIATSTSIEGPVVYVGTESPGPVTMFIVDGDDPAYAISLTLLPRQIPAVQVTLQLEGYAPGLAKDGGEDDEAIDPSYQHQLRELMRALAQGEIPRGYAMQPLGGHHPQMPECLMTGMRIVPAQVIAGRDLSVLVASVRNVSPMAAVVDERMCAANGVLAVSAWPRTHLAPGQETELFIAVGRAQAPPADRRPSTLTGAAW